MPQGEEDERKLQARSTINPEIQPKESNLHCNCDRKAQCARKLQINLRNRNTHIDTRTHTNTQFHRVPCKQLHCNRLFQACVSICAQMKTFLASQDGITDL
ncbi:unnamed protein product [Prorocentrum cordatum]|uniref:Uncharacterized protein n=1 Tax=Prorocentrum cordatum TaxID=2364126 RepID=A0ABN9UPR3_9DINO|nr:unnamed protein product [Polarella glacialis]|mmetsp:Transcript_57597/g.160352  ORF Transcript_57597/g.160352 Transcript_57597/m.160352 type:complete len:101 (-) Transcript_57597:16-318(-)